MEQVRRDKSHATIERLNKSDGHYSIGTDAARSVITMRDSSFERLQEKLSTRQYHAGVKFRHHWYHAGMAGRLQSLDLDRVFSRDTGPNSSLPEAAFHHKQWRGAVNCLDRISRDITQAVTWLVCEEKTLTMVGSNLIGRNRPERSQRRDAFKSLVMGLDGLVVFWSL